MLLLSVWRYCVRRFPLRYSPLNWGAVFPVGMYAVSTFEMAKAMHVDFLQVIPRYTVYVALAAWLATFVGAVRSVLRVLTVGREANKSDRAAY